MFPSQPVDDSWLQPCNQRLEWLDFWGVPQGVGEKLCGGEENLSYQNNPLEELDANSKSNSYKNISNKNNGYHSDNNKNTLNNDNLATIESGNSAQRPTNENTENKKTAQTNKYKNLYQNL